MGLIRHPGLKAQVYVVCYKAKLVGVLFEKEHKNSTSNDAVKRAVKKEIFRQ